MDSPLMEELDAICEGKSKLDLAEEIWRLRREIERLRAGWIEADKIALEGRMRPEERATIFTEAANLVLSVRDDAVCSKYASVQECRAARDALWKAAEALRVVAFVVDERKPQNDSAKGDSNVG